MLRLLSLELHDFKNVESGFVRLSDVPDAGISRTGSNVAGVYGQNGSGKTSLIDALDILRRLWSGKDLEGQTRDCIAEGKNGLTIVCEFFADIALDEFDKHYECKYLVRVMRDDELVKVGEESFSVKDVESGEPLRPCFHFKHGDAIPKPASFWGALLPAKSDFRVDFAVADAVSWETSTSLLFSLKLLELMGKRVGELTNTAPEEVSETFMKRAKRAATMNLVILECALFAQNDFEVIPLRHHAMASLGFLNVITHKNLTSSHRKDTFHLFLNGPQTVRESEYKSITQTMETISKPLGALVPGLSVEVKRLSDAVMDDGGPGQTIEIISKRGETCIPFRCESEGIKKIVTILIALVNVYSNPSACVAIDELDSGVFEFLLGEILEVIAENGRGQLIFTAHNLIPLEVLSDKSIVFTTSNPENRYINFKGHRPTNNLRDQYLRAVNLGGQSEMMYEHTSKYEIDNAFYQAGKALREVRDAQTREA